MKDRRIKALRINTGLLVQFLSLSGKDRIRIDGMPDDAEIVGAFVGPEHGQAHRISHDTATLIVRSDQFEEVAPGAIPPDLLLTATRFTDPHFEGMPEVKAVSDLLSITHIDDDGMQSACIRCASEHEAASAKEAIVSALFAAHKRGQEEAAEARSTWDGPEFL